MLRSGSVRKIQAAVQDGTSIRAIARELGVARNTVRTYVRGGTEAAARPRRGSKLDPYKEQIVRWVREDHLLNVETMSERLLAQGYRGGKTIIKDFVLPLRPARQGQTPVMRYETPPGKQMQMDWGEFLYEENGQRRKVYGFTAILGYSRMRYVAFVKRCDVRTLWRCLEQACQSFGGQPERVLTDRMKSVLLGMDGHERVWNPLCAQALATVGIVPAVCRAYTPQTKGKVERTVDVVKRAFWAGVSFTDLDDLNAQAHAWCDRINGRVHRSTRRRPCAMLPEEGLRPLAPHTLWAPFVREERRVSWDGFISVDGVLYGLPAAATVAGTTVAVERDRQQLVVWVGERLIAQLPRQSGGIAVHPAQGDGVASAAVRQRRVQPLGHQHAAPVVAQRPLATYDVLCGVEVPA